MDLSDLEASNIGMASSNRENITDDSCSLIAHGETLVRVAGLRMTAVLRMRPGRMNKVSKPQGNLSDVVSLGVFPAG